MMKLTAVTLTVNRRKVQLFIPLPVINGKTILPMPVYNKILDDLRARHGDTVSIG